MGFTGQFDPRLKTAQQDAMESFRVRGTAVTNDPSLNSVYTGAFPTFNERVSGLAHFGGTVFVKKTAAVWKDIPLAELKNATLDDFPSRMGATNIWASEHGFLGGFPNFFHADYGHGIVCGTILILKSPANDAKWLDIPLAELAGKPALDDISGLFRGVQPYAVAHGFIGGFPTLMHADYGHGVVCGAVLLNANAAKFDDILLKTDPR
jgi:hypothetical protein